MIILVALIVLPATLAASATCKMFQDVDINPHTPGIGHAAASSIDDCCTLCSSPEWWGKGCRFYTLSKGQCWFKASNASVVKSPGKISGHASAQVVPPAPPPLPPWPKQGTSGNWTRVGPWGIGDDIEGKGEAGTLADAVSPWGNPSIIYSGGRNNGASSGVLKSVDGGDHWVIKSKGIFDTRVVALGIVDMDKGDHVLMSAPGKIYETTDGAETWTLLNVSLGTCYTFKNGTIGGEKYTLASCDCGIANRPIAGGDWNCIGPGGWGRGGYLTVSDADGSGKLLENSVLGGCLGGHVFIGTIINTTLVDWTTVNGTGRPCVMLAMNPNNKDHFIYTKPPLTYQSMDGGATYESLNHSNIFHAGIDRKGALYTAAMGGAFVSHDCGPGPNMKRPCSWQAYYDNRTARRPPHGVRIRGAHDYQRICLDFAGTVAHVSDQGIFIVEYTNSSNLELIKANGDMSNNIALKAAISKGKGTKETRSIVTAIWDWAPLGSWDNGAHWPSWQNPEDGPGASCIGEGGGAYAMGASNHVLIMHHHNIMHSAVGGQNMTRFITPHAGTIFGPSYQTMPGSRSEPNGFVMAPLFITVPWDSVFDQAIPSSECQNPVDITANLTQHTNYSCLSAVDFGYVYGTHAVDYAMWDGTSCVTCNVAGNSSAWKWVPKTGVVSYVRQVKESERSYKRMLKYDMNGDGMVDASDMAASMLHEEKELEEAQGSLELKHHREKAKRKAEKAEKADGDENDDGDDDDDDEERKARNPLDNPHHMHHRYRHRGLEVDDTETYLDKNKYITTVDEALRGGSSVYILKSFNYGAGTTNWTYTLVPPHIGVPSFVTDPTNQSVIYTVNGACIAASYDTGDTWSPCWNEPPPPPSVDVAGFHKSAGDLPAGHDINVAEMTETAAEAWCKAQVNCSGFTAQSAGGASATKKIWFKENTSRPMGADPSWVSYVKAAAPGPPPPTSHAGLVGSFAGMTIKDSQHMFVSRLNDVPLQTTDGGATWTPMKCPQLALVAKIRYGMIYSWTAKTLIMMGAGGTQSDDHPHAAFVWMSNDDGETWTDETSDELVTMGPGASNWYENDFYINSLGQGIMVKTLE